MKIQSKKTSRIYDVSAEQWDEMLRRRESRLYRVIDDSDEEVAIVDVEPIELKSSEEEDIKRKLDDAGIYYHPNTGIKKLKQKLEEYEESDDERADEALQQD